MVSVRKSKVFASLLVFVIVGLLVVAGPAEGISANLSLNNPFPTKGQIIKFTAQVNSDSGEILDIDEIVLQLNGAENAACRFTVEGNKIAGCEGIEITRISAPALSFGTYGYGYGYGYGYNGALTYEILLDTSEYNSGDYTTSVKVVYGGRTYTQQGGTLNIKSGGGSGGHCITDWTCTSWSVCENGVQTRTCQKVKEGCYGGSDPVEARACSAPNTNLLSNAANEPLALGGNSDDDNRSENVTMNAFSSAITGAVTGAVGSIAGSGYGLILGLLVALIILMIIIIAVVRRQRQTMPSKFYF